MEEPSKVRGVNYRSHEDVAFAARGCLSAVILSKGSINPAKFEEILRADDKFVAERTPESLAQRFQTIFRAVSKFVGCYEHVVETLGSWRSPTDVQRDAIALYESEKSNGVFKFAQCWSLLKDSAKWGARRDANQKRKGSSKRPLETMSEDFTHDQTATSRAKTSQSISHVDKNDEKGVSKAKLERNNLALYAREVKAAERAVTNSDMRMRIVQEQMEINLFTVKLTQPTVRCAFCAIELSVRQSNVPRPCGMILGTEKSAAALSRGGAQ
ncbi:hypothetical protein AC1031_007569 [Aphanomyces cochlioides]|nr:hypothetical protein AC1031_007569 [Aphanomyces cochlioides]